MSPIIPLCEPWLSGKEWSYVKECLESGWIATAGPWIDRFEKAVACFTGSPHCVAVASGTAALHLSLLASGVAPEEEVLVSDITFVAPVNTIRYCGAHPVLMDIDPVHWQMDVSKVERFLREACRFENGIVRNKKTYRRVSAILAVHLLGLCPPVDRLAALAKEFHLKLIEDAAEGLGVRYQGRHVGLFGDAGTLSFNGNKLVTSGSGGMVLTRDKATADRVRYLATQAKDNPDTFFHGAIGFNYRLTNLHAALGAAQMEEVAERIAKKRRIASFYQKALEGLARVAWMRPLPGCEPTYWLCTVLLENERLKKAALDRFHEQGIMARPLFYPIHRLPPYREAQAFAITAADDVHARGVCLPSGLGLGEEALETVVACLKDTLSREDKKHV